MPKLRYLLVDAEGINHIDATGEKAMHDVVDRLRASGVEVRFFRAKFQVLDALRRAGSMEEIGEERFLPHADRALQEAWERLAAGPDPCERDCPTECPLNRARVGAPNYRV
jgi:MFS superfamily sulfate permease-like transporter